jgi:hypothetical protein
VDRISLSAIRNKQELLFGEYPSNHICPVAIGREPKEVVLQSMERGFQWIPKMPGKVEEDRRFRFYGLLEVHQTERRMSEWQSEASVYSS